MSEYPVAFDELDLVQSICRESFYEFVKEFWSEIVTEEMVDNWHIRYLCNELQKVAERIFKRQSKLYDLVINVPPGSSKSTICSILFPAWCWIRMKECVIISVSYEHSLAGEFSRKSRNVITSEKYQAAFPGIALADDQNTKHAYENTEGGARRAAGAGGNVTGRHAHCIIIDDPINPKAATSDADRKEINTWMKETLPSRKINKDTAPTILIQQRLHQDDQTAQMMDRSDGDNPVKHICIPCDTSYEVKPAKLKLYYDADGLMDPIRLSRKILKAARKQLGEYGYAGQFGQSPVPLGGGMFKWERFRYEEPTDLKYFKMLVRAWDKAGTEGDGAHTVGCLMGLDKKGQYWVLDVVRGQWDSGEREAIILQTAQNDGKSVIVSLEQEPGSGGKESAMNSAKMLAGFRVRIQRPSGDKVLRADPYSSQVNARNVILAKGRAFIPEYIDELKFFPFSKYKDQTDASSQAFSIISAGKIVLGKSSQEQK